MIRIAIATGAFLTFIAAPFVDSYADVIQSSTSAQYAWSGNHQQDSTQEFAPSSPSSDENKHFSSIGSLVDNVSTVSTSEAMYGSIFANGAVVGSALHAYATVENLHGAWLDELAANAHASASVTDVFDFSPTANSPSNLDAAYVVARFSISGALSANLKNPDLSSSPVVSGFTFLAEAQATSYQQGSVFTSHDDKSAYASLVPQKVGPSTKSISQIVQLTIPTKLFADGKPPIDLFSFQQPMVLTMDSTLNVSVAASRFGSDASENLTATANLKDTAELIGIGLVDSNGNPIPLSDYTMTAESGIVYPTLFDSQVVPVPEPSSIVHLCAGLVIMLIASYRRLVLFNDLAKCGR